MKTILIFFTVMLTFCLVSFKGYAQDTHPTGTTQPDDNAIKDGITKVDQMFSSGDKAKLGDYIDDGFIEHSPMPGQGPGLQGLKDAMKSMKIAFPDMNFTINDMIISGDKAAVLFTFTGTNTGEMMGMKATGKQVNVQGVDYLYFKNGKATEHWGYMDTDAYMQQMGYSNQK